MDVNTFENKVLFEQIEDFECATSCAFNKLFRLFDAL